MDKLLLEKYIKVAARKALKEQEELHQKSEKAVYIIYKFPGLKKVMEDLMSPAFARYISSVTIVSPKPTTLNLKLINGQSFQLYYSGKNNFVAKIAGKKYNTSEIDEVERASKAITTLLILNYSSPEELEKDAASKKDNDLKKDLSSFGGDSGGGNFPGSEETPPPAIDGADSDVSDADLDSLPPDNTGGEEANVAPEEEDDGNDTEDIEI